MSRNDHIAALNELGQVVWYDNLSRDVLQSGELKQLIASGVSGLTSNPTIFKQAIADSTNYDAIMSQPAYKQLNTEQLCEELMITDVAAASDLLLPTYEASQARDGYASIEVSPYLAEDYAQTVEAARRIWKKLNRPNIMIKIPATAECIPAIKTVLEDGINVNVTLIFSEEIYRKVVEAYISALETRASKNQDISKIASVASFFVSRVDAACEKAFDASVQAGKAKAEDKAKLLGKVGVANSKMAYAAFEEICGSERWKKLAAKGAKVQRPLWASTGTKNPAFKATMYVEELAGRDTVDTMPPATLKAVLQGLTTEPRLHQNLDAARALVASLKNYGISFDTVLKELQDQGVKLFSDAYRDLVASVEKKRAVVS